MAGYETNTAETSALYAGSTGKTADALEKKLSQIGMSLYICPDYKNLCKLLQIRKFSIVIIDHHQIKEQSPQLCNLIRANHQSYPIILIIMQTLNCDIEESLFEAGANDVVNIRHTAGNLLYHRIKNHLTLAGRLSRLENIHKIQNTTIDLNRREIHRNGKTEKLRGIIYDLLKYFIENPNRVITREELFNQLWSDSICTEPSEGGKTIDVTVSKLRKIVEVKPSKPAIIESVRAAGWKFNKQILI